MSVRSSLATILLLRVPGVLGVLGAAATTSACAMHNLPDANSTTHTSSSESSGADGKKSDDDKPDAVTTGLPAAAAHASIAWLVARIGDVPDAPLGGTAQTKVDDAKAESFVAELAIGNVAPSLLRTRNLPKTATALEAVKPITDAASLKVAQTVVANAEKAAQDELKTIEGSSDAHSAEEASERVFLPLDALLADLEKRIAAKAAPIRDRLLSPWVAMLEHANDDTKIEVLERDLPLVVTLMKSGRAPKRTTKTAPRWVHPANRTYLTQIALHWPIADAAQVLGIDATDTLRGRNVDVDALAANVAMRELAPRVLESCGDAPDAAKLRALKPIKDEASLKAALDVFGPMTDDASSPSHLCAEAAHQTEQSSSEATSAFELQRKKMNDHPYYARNAIAGWAQAFAFLEAHGVSKDEVRGLAMKSLDGFVTKVRAMPRRSETTREPKN